MATTAKPKQSSKKPASKPAAPTSEKLTQKDIDKLLKETHATDKDANGQPKWVIDGVNTWRLGGYLVQVTKAKEGDKKGTWFAKVKRPDNTILTESVEMQSYKDMGAYARLIREDLLKAQA